MIVAPGAYDGMTARLIAQAGFPAVYMTGAGTSATLGYPDFGLLTMTEMVANAAPHRARRRCAGDRRRRHRLRQRTEHRAHGAGIRARGVVGHPYRGPGLAQAVRPSRQQGDRAARGLAGEDPRRRRRPPRSGLPDHRAHRLRAPSPASRKRSRAPTPRCRPAPTWRSSRRRRPWRRWRRCRDWCRPVPAERGAAGGKTPEIDLREAERMGYKLAIVPGLLLKAAIGACDAALAALAADASPPGAATPT